MTLRWWHNVIESPATTVLRGGPSDGLRCVTTGLRPIVILELPHRASPHEIPMREAYWDELHRWYELRGEVVIEVVEGEADVR